MASFALEASDAYAKHLAEWRGVKLPEEALYIIKFKSTKPGAKLHVTWEQDDDGANLTWQAAALEYDAADDSAAPGPHAGAVTAAVTEPLDVVRTRLQTQRRPAAGVGGTDFGYTGLLDGLVKASRLFLRLGEDLAPFMFELPRAFQAPTLFKSLGTRHAPTVADYAGFLSELHAECGGHALNPNELSAVLKV